MALIHFTVGEIRGMLAAVLPGYQAQYEGLKEEYEKKLASYKKRRDAYWAERDAEPKRREELLRARAKEDFEKQESWRDKHPIRSFFGGKWKTEEEFYEHHKRTTIWPYSPFYFDFMLRPSCPEHSRLTFCQDLSKKLSDYEDDRVVGLHPGEVEILNPDENTSDMGTASEQ